MSKAMILDHPLVQHKVSLLRDKTTGTKEFKALVSELAMLLCYEATRDLPTEEVAIETPIAVAKTRVLSGRKLALVPILRAGLGMVDGMLALIPAAKVGHIGLYRNEETLESITASCPRTLPSARSLCWTRCWPRAAVPLMPSRKSKSAVRKASNLSALSARRKGWSA